MIAGSKKRAARIQGTGRRTVPHHRDQKHGRTVAREGLGDLFEATLALQVCLKIACSRALDPQSVASHSLRAFGSDGVPFIGNQGYATINLCLIAGV